GRYEDLEKWGPANAYGGPWVADKIEAGVASDPFLIAGFDRRVLHLALGGERLEPAAGTQLRASDGQEIRSLPVSLAGLPRVTIRRGDFHQPAPGYSFQVNRPVTVYLAVDVRGNPSPGQEWSKTDLGLTWGNDYRDGVYRRDFEAGVVEIPGNDAEHKPGDFGMPHTAFVACQAGDLTIEPSPGAKVTVTPVTESAKPAKSGPVRFALEVDAKGDGRWEKLDTVEVPEEGYVCHIVSEDLQAQWIRLSADRDCVATAYFHMTGKDPAPVDTALFAGLADAGAAKVRGARIYAAKRNRNLRVIADGGRHFDFVKETFAFRAEEADPEVATLLDVEPEFTVDEASVIVARGGRRLRLPKGSAAYDEPFASGWPRGTRELESERFLSNLHGTFYEIPRTDGSAPAYEMMRPVCSHSRQITDFCTWNGLLVLAGVRPDAKADGHVFADETKDTALWFGGIDDLWQIGKPVGHGGPWKDSAVEADQPSDPYLMTGYDRKTLTLKADRDVRVTIEVDVDHQSGWRSYRTVPLEAGAEWAEELPAGFSAHWVRFRADSDCTATAWLVYE
ncbi:MAG: sulfatase-like hydrolase/transferase, partial [Thermoguttaceae bacterium]